MTNLTVDQIRQLNMYSIYINAPERPLFSLADLLNPAKTEDVIHTVQATSQSPNKTVAASISCRFGMFTAMQLYNLAAYDEVRKGSSIKSFWCNRGYGKLSVSTL